LFSGLVNDSYLSGFYLMINEEFFWQTIFRLFFVVEMKGLDPCPEVLLKQFYKLSLF